MSIQTLTKNPVNQSNLNLFLSIFPATLASTLIGMASNVVNAIMAAKISTLAMASIALGGSIIWPLNSLGIGFLSIIQAKMGYKLGKGEDSEVGRIHRQAYYLIIIATIMISSIIIGISSILNVFHMDPAMETLVRPYILLNIINVPIFLLIAQFRNINSIIAYTLPTMYASIINIALLVPLNYIFMFGVIPGVAVNPVLSSFVTTTNGLLTLAFFYYFFHKKEQKYRKLELFKNYFDKIDWHFIWDSLKVGVPISLQYYLENSFYGIITILIAHLGVAVVAAHETGMICYGVIYGLGLSASGALTSIVSRRLGEKRRDLAHQALIYVTLFIFILNIFSGSTVIYFREEISLYLTSNSSDAVFMATQILIFLAFSNLFDGVYTCLLGYLVPYRDTTFTMTTTIIVNWCFYMPLACIFAFTTWLYYGNYGVYAFWGSFIMIAITCSAIFTYRALYWVKISDQKLYQRLQANDLY